MNASPARLERQVAELLEQAGIPSSRAEAGLLLQAASGLSRSELLLQEVPMAREAFQRLKKMLARRLTREPLQYITGSSNFYGLELKVDSRALIPRPETERLVELALERIRHLAEPAVIDIATGSGAIALALKAGRPEANVLASDISAAALELAAENAVSHGLEIGFRQADLLSGLAESARHADLLISNPPYLPESDRHSVSPEVQRDPERALFAGEGGLEVFWRLLKEAGPLLKPGAWLLVELDPRNVHAAAAEAAAYGTVTVEMDLAGRERFLLLNRQ